MPLLWFVKLEISSWVYRHSYKHHAVLHPAFFPTNIFALLPKLQPLTGEARDCSRVHVRVKPSERALFI